MRLFNESCQAQYIASHFGTRYLRAFLRLTPGSYKSDMFRYAVLVHEGGYYHDLDMRLLAPEALRSLRNRSFVAAIDGGTHSRVAGGFVLGAVPNSGLLRCALDAVLANSERRAWWEDPMDPWGPALDITGPGVLGRCLHQATNRTSHRSLARDATKPSLQERIELSDLRAKLLESSHKGPKSPFTQALLGQTAVVRAVAAGGAAYPTARTEPCKTRPHYQRLYHSRQIYLDEAMVDEQARVVHAQRKQLLCETSSHNRRHAHALLSTH